MAILLFAFIVLIIAALLIYGVDLLSAALNFGAPIPALLKVLVIVIAVLVICQKAGLI